MTRDDVTTLIANISDLQRRIQFLTEKKDEHSLVLHWTDTQTLIDAVRALQAMQSRLDNAEKALHLAYSVVRHA